MISAIPCSRVRKPLALCFLGSSGCGKTSIIHGFGSAVNYQSVRPESSYGVNIDYQSVTLENGANVKFNVYEIRGDRCFDNNAMLTLERVAMDAVVIMFDIADQESYNRAKEWLEMLKAYGLKSLIFLVGNDTSRGRRRRIKYDVR